MSIVVRNLVKTFGETAAVNGIGFEIPGPGVVGLIGPNGAGKTTTLRILTSYLQPTGGTACVAGFDTCTASRQVRRYLGYLPESTSLYPDARVLEFLTFRSKLKRVPWRQRRKEIERCLEICGVTGLSRRIIGRLSHGQRRRVALAETLLRDPPVLILDEPTAGLDPLQVRQFRLLLADLAAAHTVLLSTHVLAEAEAMCSRVLVMAGGRLVDDIDLERPDQQGLCCVEVCGPADIVCAALQTIAGVLAVQSSSLEHQWHRFELRYAANVDVRPEVATVCAQRGWPIRELSHARPSLETRFVRAIFSDARKAA